MSSYSPGFSNGSSESISVRFLCSLTFQNSLHAWATSRWLVCLMNRTAPSSYQRFLAPSDSPLSTPASPIAEATFATRFNRFAHLEPNRQAPKPIHTTTAMVVSTFTKGLVGLTSRELCAGSGAGTYLSAVSIDDSGGEAEGRLIRKPPGADAGGLCAATTSAGAGERVD